VTQRRLIVSADDFGIAPEVNAAVERAHRDGVLTNASLMVTGGAAADAVAVARRLPALGVGLHLVLAQGRPAAPHARIPRLVRAGGSFSDSPVASGLRFAWLSVARRGAAELPAGTSEVYCHPSTASSPVLARHQRDYANARELAALTDPETRAVAQAAGVELVSYHALAA
jgi:predicted glycoside hydrolase/deacetylase ChbG (UPF0249 family)